MRSVPKSACHFFLGSDLGVWDTLKLTKKKRRKTKAIRPCEKKKSWKQRELFLAIFCEFQREQNTKRESFSWRCSPKNREKHSESVREWKRKRRHFSLLKLYTRKINWWSSHGVFWVLQLWRVGVFKGRFCYWFCGGIVFTPWD